jgi:hypothetical protein
VAWALVSYCMIKRPSGQWIVESYEHRRKTS